MLPFNKRRNNSEIEIQTDEVEPVQLPPVRPPSVRPAAGAAPRYSSSRPPAPMSSRSLPSPSAPPPRPSTRPPISFRPPSDDNERTLMVAEKAPRRTLDLRSPKMPTFDEPSVIPPRESFSDEEATRIHPNSSRSVLSMSSPSARRMLDESSGRIRSDVPPPPVSSLRMEEPRSAAAIDMSMTVGASASQSQQVTSSTKLNPGRPTAVWAAALVAVGVFTGLAAALVARGGSDSFVTASAALIDPSQGPQIVATPPQNVGATVAAAPVHTAAAPVQNTQNAQTIGAQTTAQAVSAALTPAASCAADVTPTAKAADTKVAAAPAVVADTKVADVKPAAPPVVAAAPKPPVAAAPKPPVVAAAPKPVVAAPKPAVAAPKPASKGSDIDSASAADALAKAQLEQSLGR